MNNRSSIKAFLVFEAAGANERFQDDMCQTWLRFLLPLSPGNAAALRFRIEEALGLSVEVVGRPRGPRKVNEPLVAKQGRRNMSIAS